METAPGSVHPSVMVCGTVAFRDRRVSAQVAPKAGTRPTHHGSRQALLLRPGSWPGEWDWDTVQCDPAIGTKWMSRTSNTKRYYEIARDCLRSAQHADNPATRDKLLDQAQVWMDAAMRETFIATIGAGDPHEPSQPDLRNEARALRSGSRRTMSR